MNHQIIAELKEELHSMEVASSPHEFDKHLYAMERLLKLLKNRESEDEANAPSHRAASSSETLDDARMLELMGGKSRTTGASRPPAAGERPATDDGAGNGDSIFDF